MSEPLLRSSDNSFESSITENPDETFDSYSLLFDKAKHNFSTSSEISFIRNELSPIENNQTITKQTSITNDDINSNPWLLLFVQNDDQQTNQIELNVQPIYSPIDSKESYDDNEKVTQWASPRQGPINKKTTVFHQQQQQHSKRDSFKNRRTTNQSSDDDDQAFEKFLQEHRTADPVKSPEKSPIKARRKNRNSLKDFICDSSSDEEHPSEFYPKVDRLIEKDPSWRKVDDDYSSDETNSSSTESDDDQTDRKISVTFLESLSNYVPIDDKHPDAKQYFTRSGFKNKKKRQELAEKLFAMFDQDVFSSKLSDKITIVWSGRLTATAGHCATRRSAQTATITLSHKVCDSPERCRDTLLHELCHAAVSLIDGNMDDGHGPVWRKWTRRAERCYTYLPAISVKHTYDIAYKFTYRCVRCRYEVHRHSKSLDVEIDFCGRCMGKFELLLNNNKNENQTPKKTLSRYNLFIKEHFQTMKQAQPHLSTPQLMKHLSQEYKKTIQQPQIDLSDFEQLKI